MDPNVKGLRIGIKEELYWVLRFPLEEPEGFEPSLLNETYKRDYSGRYFCYNQLGRVTHRIHKSVWFDSKEAAEWHRSDLGMPYLKAIPIEIRIG